MALADVKVLDLTRFLAGPYCTMVLSDLGADVVKVEPPGGDYVRSTPPFVEDSDEPFGGYFQSINRGKRSIELDLTAEEDRAAFLDLVDRADVLVENYQAGTMSDLGLPAERLRNRNPDLVYASIRGFGDPRTGAADRQGRPAYDLVVQALAGVMSINGQADGPPTKVGVGIGDIFTGVLSAVGILAALYDRERTGTASYVDTSMYDSMISLCERAIYRYSYADTIHSRHGNAHPTLFPYDAFETADGVVVIAALEPDQWRDLCSAMDRPDLAELTDQRDRLRERDRLAESIEAWTSERSTAAVLDALAPTVPCAPVRDVEAVFEDDVARDRDMLVEVTHPTTGEAVEIAGQPIKLGAYETVPQRRAPLLDEHRTEILREWANSHAGSASTRGSWAGGDE